MRKLMLIGLTMTAVLAIAAVAIAQTSAPAQVTVTGQVTPAKGGTTKKPVNAGTVIKFDVNPDSNSTLAGVDYGLPSSIRVSGAGFKPCSAATINAAGGDTSVCKSAPIVGTGSATALLGPGKTPITFSVQVFANGAKGLTLALQQDNGSVAVAFAAKLSGNHVAFQIPSNIQQPAPGLYSFVTSVTATLGPAKATSTSTKKVKVTKKVHGRKRKVTKKVKVKKTSFLVSRTGCAGGNDPFSATLTLAPNPNPPAQSTITGSSSVPCS